MFFITFFFFFTFDNSLSESIYSIFIMNKDHASRSNSKEKKNGDIEGNSCDCSEGDCGNVVANAGTFIEEQLQLPTVPDVGLLHTSS